VKVLLVANSAWGLYNFRLPIARALMERGALVSLVCPEGPYTPKLEEMGFRVLRWQLDRRNLGPLGELRSLAGLWRIYRSERPDVVHHFTIKPNVHGTVAARLARVPRIINTWTGLGWMFSDAAKARALRPGLLLVMRRLYRSSQVQSVFQTAADQDTLVEHRLVPRGRTRIIAGTGVDTAKFHPGSEAPARPPVVIMSARLLRDKGVGEFVEAARLLHNKGMKVMFWVAGAPDPGNRESVTEMEVARWRDEGLVQFLGHRSDMPEMLRQSSIAALPTYYGEGIPLSLLEAASTGLPIVTTAAEGCRAVVQEGINGLIVPRRDAQSLADAIETLVRDPRLRDRMGQESRRVAVEQFEQSKIVEQYLDLYRELGVLPPQERQAARKAKQKLA
jgi:glycosyltransferase involved in cell wall biosynthesis